MGDLPTEGRARRILLGDLHPGSWGVLVELLLQAARRWRSFPGGRVDPCRVDLAITGVETIDTQVPRLHVGVNGIDSQLEIPYGTCHNEHVDVLLAYLFNELDGRYGQRYAFLVGDSSSPGTTAYVLAALLWVAQIESSPVR